MEVEVKLFAALRKGRFKTKQMALSDSAPLSGVLDQLGIAPGDVGILLVNGRSAEVASELTDGDVVSVFPSIGGG